MDYLPLSALSSWILCINLGHALLFWVMYIHSGLRIPPTWWCTITTLAVYQSPNDIIQLIILSCITSFWVLYHNLWLRNNIWIMLHYLGLRTIILFQYKMLCTIILVVYHLLGLRITILECVPPFWVLCTLSYLDNVGLSPSWIMYHYCFWPPFCFICTDYNYFVEFILYSSHHKIFLHATVILSDTICRSSLRIIKLITYTFNTHENNLWHTNHAIFTYN